MRPWWERWPDRFEFELAEGKRFALDLTLDDDERRRGRIVLRGSISHGGRVVQLVAVYPDTFPYTPPQIYAPDEALPRHQNPYGKNLCVLPIGSQFWRERPSVASLIASRVPALLDAVAAGGETLAAAEIPQGEPISEFYERHPIGSILIPAPPGVAGRTGKCRIRFRETGQWLIDAVRQRTPCVGQGLLLEVTGEGGGNWSAPERIRDTFRGRALDLPWIRFDERFPSANPAEIHAFVRSRHATLLDRAGKIEADGVTLRIVALVFREEVRQGEYEDAWLFLCGGEFVEVVPGLPKREKTTGFFLLRGSRAGRRDLSTRIPTLRPLRDRCAAIVGLGALGSVVAVELARGMVGELHLLDFDTVEAGNAVRWAHGFGYAGVEKAVALAHYLEIHYPHTRVVQHAKPVGEASREPSGRCERETLEAWAQDADLFIDASAEDNVSYVVSDLATEAQRPQIYAYSIEGYGGVVARVRPDATGCFHCLLLREADKSVRRPVAPPNMPTVQPFGCSTPTFLAPNIDLLPIAVEATRLAVSTLCERENSYPAIDGDVFTLQLRRPEDGGLVYPLAWRADGLVVHPDCPVCHAHASR